MNYLEYQDYQYYLYHHGVKGQKWGVRRYQNKDGSLTARGKKHKEAALKGIVEGQAEYANRAKLMKSYTETNKKALKKGMQYDKEAGEGTSWNTHRLRDAYKATGRDYVNSMTNAKLYEEYHKAYSNNTIQVGRDYVIKNYKKGIVQLTESGRQKEAEIQDRVMSEFRQKYAKEIKEFT